MTLNKGLHNFSQPLDYVGIPFDCPQCHKCGHLVGECNLLFPKNAWGKNDSKEGNKKV